MDFVGLNSVAVISVVLVVCAGALTGLIAYLILKTVRENSVDYKRQEQLDYILYGEDESPAKRSETEDVSWISKKIRAWNAHWGRLLAQVSPGFDESTSKGGIFVLAVWLVVGVIVAVVFKNPPAGAIIATLLVVVLHFVLNARSYAYSEKIREQVTGFLFALKANVQANETTERAVMKVIDTMPDPLYGEVVPMKNQMLSGIPFREACEELKDRTQSPDLRFLAACMIQATSTGSSLEKQISTIQNTIVERQRITDEIAKSTRTANITIWVATFLLPSAFIAIYFLDSSARDFWFIHPLSWIIFIAVIGLYGVGVFIARKFVGSVKKL